MKWLVPVAVAAAGAALARRRGARDQVARFRDDVRQGMGARETQLREVLAMDTHLTLPGERVDDTQIRSSSSCRVGDADHPSFGRNADARAIEGR